MRTRFVIMAFTAAMLLLATLAPAGQPGVDAAEFRVNEHQLFISWNEPVTVAADAVILVNKFTSQQFTALDAPVIVGGNTDSRWWAPSDVGDGPFFDKGKYLVWIRADKVTSVSTGQPMPMDYQFTFFYQPGDFSPRDGIINGDDYAKLDFNFGAPPIPAMYSDGDFNYDGQITGDDYSIIDFQDGAEQTGTTSPLPPLAPLAQAVTGDGVPSITVQVLAPSIRSNIDGYSLYRSDDGGDTWEIRDEKFGAGGYTGAPIVFTQTAAHGIQHGVGYQFHVAAFGEADDWSNWSFPTVAATDTD